MEGKSRLQQLADELEDSDEVTEQHLHFEDLPPGTKIEADATGRLKAISVPDDDRVTPTDPPKVQSDAPSSRVTKLKLFDPARINSIPAAIAFVALVVAVVVLAIWGPSWLRGAIPP